MNCHLPMKLTSLCTPTPPTHTRTHTHTHTPANKPSLVFISSDMVDTKIDLSLMIVKYNYMTCAHRTSQAEWWGSHIRYTPSYSQAHKPQPRSSILHVGLTDVNVPMRTGRLNEDALDLCLCMCVCIKNRNGQAAGAAMINVLLSIWAISTPWLYSSLYFLALLFKYSIILLFIL